PQPAGSGKNGAKEADTQGLCVMFGALRSGTSMLRLMLNGHPRLICPGETDFLVDFLQRAPDGSWHYDLERLSENRIFRSSRANLPETADAATAFKAMLADLRGDEPGTLVLVLHRNLGRLLDLVPDIPAIHILRDPRDVARSTIGMGWSGHVYFGTEFWMETEHEWDRNVARISEDRQIETRYEDLVRDPEAALGEISTFLGEDYDPGMLSYPDYTTYDRPDPALAEQWRRKLSPNELGLVEPLFGDLLEGRGYTPSGEPPRTPGQIEWLRMWVKHKRSVWRFRINKFGLHDPLIVAIAKRVGLAHLTLPAQRRMREITQQNLK
ncbi:MAG: sulfotransferase, partial [Pseudomonadota bacterium]